jgi:hypothetical protein
MRSEGGFAPIEWVLGRGPVYTVLADGTLIYEGPMIEIFPGPLLPNYQQAVISQGELDQLMNLIERVGLPDMVDEVDDSAAQNVADATTEVFVYWDEEGNEHKFSIYALGIDPEPENPATKLALELRNVLDQLTATSEAVPYEADRVRVLAGPGFFDVDFQDIRPWPLEETAYDGWTATPNPEWMCKAYGPDILEKFTGATQNTAWTQPDGAETTDEDTEVKLLVRPLLPGEPDCPTEAAIGG